MNIQVLKNGEYFSIISGSDNIHINNSYKIKSRSDMEYILENIKFQSFPSALINNINFNDAIDEWRAHNLLYVLHLWRSHTKDVDINKNKWYIKIIYKILSFLYF